MGSFSWNKADKLTAIENDMWSFNIPTTFTSDIQIRNLKHLTEKYHESI